jgi:nucleotide-binding universal stress UspA family protein
VTIYRRILVAIDGSVQSERCLDHAIALASDQGAVLRIIHAVDYIVPTFDTTNVPPGQLHQAYLDAGNRTVASALARARVAGVSAEAAVIDTDDPRTHASEVILRDVAEWHPDVLVLGAHGRAGVSRVFLGSVSEAVLRSATVPVLVLRTTG